MQTNLMYATAFDALDVQCWAIEHFGYGHGLRVQELNTIDFEYAIRPGQSPLQVKTFRGWIKFPHHDMMQAFYLQHGANINVMTAPEAAFFTYRLPDKLEFHGNLMLLQVKNQDARSHAYALTVYGDLDISDLINHDMLEHIKVHGAIHGIDR